MNTLGEHIGNLGNILGAQWKTIGNLKGTCWEQKENENNLPPFSFFLCSQHVPFKCAMGSKCIPKGVPYNTSL